MDPLTQTLVQRQLPDQTSATSQPAVVSQHTNTPPAKKRFETAQAMQNSYANGWQPNPILLRVLMGRKGSQ